MKAQNISAMTTAAMVAEYNSLTGKSIKKFSSRAAGEKQLEAARTKAGVAVIKEVVAKVVKAKVVKAKVEKKETTNRADAIKKSWADPKVAAARSERTHVKASGKMFRSVKQAFEELGLPLEKHIRFRMQLKQVAEMTFNHEGRTIKFAVVQE